jgi:hypothetical protein
VPHKTIDHASEKQSRHPEHWIEDAIHS